MSEEMPDMTRKPPKRLKSKRVDIQVKTADPEELRKVLGTGFTAFPPRPTEPRKPRR